MDKRYVYGYSGDKFYATTVFVVKERLTHSLQGIFSTQKLAQEYIDRQTYRDELVIVETVTDYYSH